jgi:enoyl-CoA hydratase
MTDLDFRQEGRAGRITFTRPQALNALSHPMALAIEGALDRWRADPGVAVVLIDAEGARAFCAGGDIAAMYHAGRAGDFDAARRFWRDEYRMNAKIAAYPKPIVALMQGFVMGGGVGVGGHARHRVVGESTQVAMPECGIGLVPDVGGSWLLARAPGRAGEYLGLTGARMGPGDAIWAGFADRFVPEAEWPALTRALIETGDPAAIPDHPAPPSALAAAMAALGPAFAAPTVADVAAALGPVETPEAAAARAAIARNAPLSMAATLAIVRAARADRDLRAAIAREFRFTARAIAQGEFLEGVRAQVIDKDRAPRWRHAGPGAVDPAEVAAMLAPLGPEWRIWEDIA